MSLFSTSRPRRTASHERLYVLASQGDYSAKLRFNAVEARILEYETSRLRPSWPDAVTTIRRLQGTTLQALRNGAVEKSHAEDLDRLQRTLETVRQRAIAKNKPATHDVAVLLGQFLGLSPNEQAQDPSEAQQNVKKEKQASGKRSKTVAKGAEALAKFTATTNMVKKATASQAQQSQQPSSYPASASTQPPQTSHPAAVPTQEGPSPPLTTVQPPPPPQEQQHAYPPYRAGQPQQVPYTAPPNIPIVPVQQPPPATVPPYTATPSQQNDATLTHAEPAVQPAVPTPGVPAAGQASPTAPFAASKPAQTPVHAPNQDPSSSGPAQVFETSNSFSFSQHDSQSAITPQAAPGGSSTGSQPSIPVQPAISGGVQQTTTPATVPPIAPEVLRGIPLVPVVDPSSMQFSAPGSPLPQQKRMSASSPLPGQGVKARVLSFFRTSSGKSQHSQQSQGNALHPTASPPPPQAYPFAQAQPGPPAQQQAYAAAQPQHQFSIPQQSYVVGQTGTSPATVQGSASHPHQQPAPQAQQQANVSVIPQQSSTGTHRVGLTSMGPGHPSGGGPILPSIRYPVPSYQLVTIGKMEGISGPQLAQEGTAAIAHGPSSDAVAAERRPPGEASIVAAFETALASVESQTSGLKNDYPEIPGGEEDRTIIMVGRDSQSLDQGPSGMVTKLQELRDSTATGLEAAQRPFDGEIENGASRTDQVDEGRQPSVTPRPSTADDIGEDKTPTKLSTDDAVGAGVTDEMTDFDPDSKAENQKATGDTATSRIAGSTEEYAILEGDIRNSAGSSAIEEEHKGAGTRPADMEDPLTNTAVESTTCIGGQELTPGRDEVFQPDNEVSSVSASAVIPSKSKSTPNQSGDPVTPSYVVTAGGGESPSNHLEPVVEVSPIKETDKQGRSIAPGPSLGVTGIPPVQHELENTGEVSVKGAAESKLADDVEELPIEGDTTGEPVPLTESVSEGPQEDIQVKPHFSKSRQVGNLSEGGTSNYDAGEKNNPQVVDSNSEGFIAGSPVGEREAGLQVVQPEGLTVERVIGVKDTKEDVGCVKTDVLDGISANSSGQEERRVQMPSAAGTYLPPVRGNSEVLQNAAENNSQVQDTFTSAITVETPFPGPAKEAGKTSDSQGLLSQGITTQTLGPLDTSQRATADSTQLPNLDIKTKTKGEEETEVSHTHELGKPIEQERPGQSSSIASADRDGNRRGAQMDHVLNTEKSSKFGQVSDSAPYTMDFPQGLQVSRPSRTPTSDSPPHQRASLPSTQMINVGRLVAETEAKASEGAQKSQPTSPTLRRLAGPIQPVAPSETPVVQSSAPVVRSLAGPVQPAVPVQPPVPIPIQDPAVQQGTKENEIAANAVPSQGPAPSGNPTTQSAAVAAGNSNVSTSLRSRVSAVGGRLARLGSKKHQKTPRSPKQDAESLSTSPSPAFIPREQNMALEHQGTVGTPADLSATQITSDFSSTVRRSSISAVTERFGKFVHRLGNSESVDAAQAEAVTSGGEFCADRETEAAQQSLEPLAISPEQTAENAPLPDNTEPTQVEGADVMQQGARTSLIKTASIRSSFTNVTERFSKLKLKKPGPAVNKTADSSSSVPTVPPSAPPAEFTVAPGVAPPISTTQASQTASISSVTQTTPTAQSPHVNRAPEFVPIAVPNASVQPETSNVTSSPFGSPAPHGSQAR